MKPALRALPLIYAVLFGALCIYVALAEWLHPQPLRPPAPGIFYGITIMSAAVVGVMFVMRRLTISRSEQALANVPDDRTALNRWRIGYLISFCFSEAVGLFGMQLWFIGFSFRQVVPFYIAAFVLMLYVAPRTPSTVNAQN